MISGHTTANITNINRGTPVFLMFISSLILVSFTHFFNEKLMQWGFALRSK